MVNVSFEALGYEGIPGYVLFREDTAVFDTGGKDMTFFVHGGNSLQERLVPVLTLRRKTKEGVSYSPYVVEAEGLGDVMGTRRVRVRLKLGRMATGSLGFTVAAPKVDLGIRAAARDDVRVTIRDASGVGTFRAGRLSLPVSDDWTEVYFALEGSRDERVRIEVYHPEGIEKVTPFSPEALFAVDGVSPASVRPPPAESAARTLDWTDTIVDEGARKVFVHLATHGSVTEAELFHLLGSPRAARRFAIEFEDHARKVPFFVRIETTASGKRYVREDER
jgi:hypothetical protein